MTAPNFTGNSLGIISDSAILSVGQIMFGGTLSTGNSATVRIIIQSVQHDFTESVVSGDTLYTVINRLIAQINAAMGASGITASLANPAVPMLAIAPLRNGNPLPSIAAFVTGSITATIVSQPLNILDANPVMYGGHVNPLAPPQPGDSVLLEQQVGPDTDHPTQQTVAYGWRYTQIVDPNLATLQGEVTCGTAAPKPSNGYVAPVFKYSRGIQLYDADGNFPGDKGYGTINLPASGGIYINGAKANLQPPAAFRANLAIDQTSIQENISTLLNFSQVPVVTVVLFDTINKRWTPPAGMVELSATAMWMDATSGDYFIYICKNGAVLTGHHVKAPTMSNSVDVVDFANGTDYYDVRVLIQNGLGSHSIRGLPCYTWFQGKQL